MFCILPDDLPFEHAALIEPSTVARHMLALGNFQRGQTAVVLGAGSIGLMIVQWLRILGAERIIVTDILEDNLEIASKVGAHVTLNPSKVDVIKRNADNSSAMAPTLRWRQPAFRRSWNRPLRITRPRGKIVLAGNQPLDKSLPLTFIENMMRREISLIGCFMSYSAPFPGHEWTETIVALLEWQLGYGNAHLSPLSAFKRS